MILVIDDDIAIQISLQLLLRDEGFSVATAGKQGEALCLLNTQDVSLVLLDMNFSVDTSGRDGLELLGDIKERWPHIPVILITGWGSIELAVEGMRKGAFDFITKPWENSRITQSVNNALALAKNAKKQQNTRRQLDEKYHLGAIIGNHPGIIKILETIGNVASTSAPVLIYGESGTGKELVARAIHENSDRRNGPFVSVNLGAVPTSLFESEMFGYRKGAFTDALSDKPGKFELAHKGTLFLDEIGETDLNSQVKLLRVLQEQRIDRIGDTKTQAVDVRIVCASNRKIPAMVADGSFREDLFYRINLISIDLPPLRERKSDIPVLAKHFLEECSREYHKNITGIDEEALHFLKELPFPGNIRELKNSIERAVLYSGEDTITRELLKRCLGGASIFANTKQQLPEIGAMTIDEVEKAMVIRALEKYKFNVSQAADALGLSRQMLYRRMEKYELKNE